MINKYEFISQGKVKKIKKEKHSDKCQCRICERTRRFNRYMTKLKMGPTKKKFFNKLYEDLLCVELDRDWSNCKFEKFKEALGTEKFQEIYND